MTKRLTQLPELSELSEEDRLLVTDNEGNASKQIRAKNAQLPPTPWLRVVFLDDFFRLDSVAWDVSVTAAGKAEEVTAADADADGGDGVIRLQADSSGDDAMIAYTNDWIDPAHDPVFEARIKTPAVPSDLVFAFGLSDAAGLTVCAATIDSGKWSLSCQSNTGASSASATGATTIPASTWTRVRLEVQTGAKVELYIDDVLEATVATAAAVPQDGDECAPFFTVTWDNASGGRLIVDAVSVDLPR